MKTDVIIIGTGPAGLMAAYQLHQRKIPFIILEKNPIPGRKLLLTGGGRCNVTNNLSPREFMNALTVNQKFLYSTLSQFSSPQVIDFFTVNGVELELDKDFKYFPKSNKSADIVNTLVNSIQTFIHYNEEVIEVKKEGQFKVKTKRQTYVSKYVIVATGSESFPKTGSTGFGIKVAQSFGLNTIPFYPAETSVYVKEIADNRDLLQGIAIPNVRVSLVGTKEKEQGDILFTHFGLSGPVIQHLSEKIYHDPNKKITVSLTHLSEDELRFLFTDKSIMVKKILESIVIKRLAKYILLYLHIDNQKIGSLSKKQINRIIEHLLRFPYTINRVEAKENAYVNGGGVDTLELEPKSFESKKVRGLFFIGETVDVHGPIGGFNITIALSMGVQSTRRIGEDYA